MLTITKKENHIIYLNI